MKAFFRRMTQQSRVSIPMIENGIGKTLKISSYAGGSVLPVFMMLLNNGKNREILRASTKPVIVRSKITRKK
jgi:hypothetical protein